MLTENQKFAIFFCIVFLITYYACHKSGKSAVENVQVNSTIGAIEGFEHYTEDGSKSNVYLGIPYARPPIGKLRFSKPLPSLKSQFKLEAKKFGPACFPVHRANMASSLTYSEDCLYLNIIQPTTKKLRNKGYPIVIFIHGGGFVTGNAEHLGYKSLSEHFAAFGILAVTLQYRIGPLGFFSTGDDVLPGNIGLWDQLFALQFLHQILPSFGGNIQEITIWGNSAGAASVHALSISPHSQSLFKRAIQSSGSLFSEWALNDNVVANSLNLAKYLNCLGKNSKTIKECLKTKTMSEILDATDKMGAYDSHIRPFKFNPTFDGEFFPQPSESLMNSSGSITTLFGLAEKECAYIVNTPWHPVRNPTAIPPRNASQFHKREFQDYIDQVTVPFGEGAKALRSVIYEHYRIDTLKNEDNETWYLNQAVDMMSDLMFIVPVIRQLKARTILKQESYLFYQKHGINKAPNAVIKGASHANEQYYIFDHDYSGLSSFSEKDIIFQQNLLEGFRSFILTGKPISSGIQWPKVEAGNIRHIAFDPFPKVKETFEKERMNFWINLLHKN